MNRIQSTFLTLAPLHHGGDLATSNVRLFRRRRVNIPPHNVVSITSRFRTEEERRRAAIRLLNVVYDSIDADRKSAYGGWDEFAAKIRTSAMASDTPQAWLTRICQEFGVSTLSNSDAVSILDEFHAQEFLTQMIDETQYLIAYQRALRNEAKESRKAGGLFDAPVVPEGAPNLVFTRRQADVPYISGNAIRGKMRRLAMLDFCNRIGITNDVIKNDGTQIPVMMYHRLFTGGHITESTAYENVEQREEYLRMLPMLAVFGSAIGTMTIQGKLIVSDADLHCLENGTGDESYYRYMDIEFGTRLDSEKTETDVAIKQGAKETPTTQMIYHHEVVIPNSVFSCGFALRFTESPVVVSAFYHALQLLRDNAFLGGKSATGHGEVAFEYTIPEGATDTYTSYLEQNKDTMREWLCKQSK
jgi:CRISPR/Cas system CSM-associated protein Csm3 (group 7 of RAMP superfamily)